MRRDHISIGLLSLYWDTACKQEENHVNININIMVMCLQTKVTSKLPQEEKAWTRFLFTVLRSKS